MRAVPSLLAVAIAIAAHPAAADVQAKVDAVIARACANRAGQTVTPTRIAQAIMIETEEGVDQTPGERALANVVSPDQLVTLADAQRNRLRALRSLLVTELATKGSDQAKALIVTPQPPQPDSTPDNDWLFGTTGIYTLTCAAEEPDPAPSFQKLKRFAIRKDVEELAKVGDERKAAGSAQIVFDDFRTTNLAGEEKRTLKLNIDAAVGIRLFGNTVDSYSMLYGDYSRSRERIRTSPVATTPDNNGSADDVDVLELGVLGTTRIGGVVRTTGRAGLIVDSITDARYVAGNLSFTPITGGRPNLGVCAFNAYRSIGWGLVARCTAGIEADLRQVIQDGTAKLTQADTLFAAGGYAGFEFRRGLDVNGKPQDGLVGNITYRYLRMLSGAGPDIDRVEGSLTYRWWAGDLGFDLGLTYVDGIERKSLADEHRFGFTFGVIF